MTDEELHRRLAETLRAKAAQVPEPTGAFDPSAQVAELNVRRAPAGGAWRYALVSAALIALVVGVTTVVLVSRSDDPGGSGGPSTNVTSTAPRVAPSTTAPTSTTTQTTTPTTITSAPTTPLVFPPWTAHPQQLPDGTVPVAEFNGYMDAHSSVARDHPKALALTFTQLDPPPTEPPNAVSVEDHLRADGTHQVVVFALLADDSVAQVRYDLSFAARSDGTWRLLSASWSQRCQLHRGHQEFSIALCT
jgi:hypothetical protein